MSGCLTTLCGTLSIGGGCHISVIWPLEFHWILVPYISLHIILSKLLTPMPPHPHTIICIHTLLLTRIHHICRSLGSKLFLFPDLILGSFSTRCHYYPVHCPHRGRDLMISNQILSSHKTLFCFPASFFYAYFSAWFVCFHIPSINALKSDPNPQTHLIEMTDWVLSCNCLITDWRFE